MQITNLRPSPSPLLRFFFLCESVAQRDDRQFDVTGLLFERVFTGTSTQMPPWSLTIALVVGIYSEDRSATYALKVSAQETGKPEEAIWRSQIGLVNDQYMPVQVQRYDLTFHQPGTFWFNLYLDGDLAARYPLKVDYAPTGNPLDHDTL